MMGIVSGVDSFGVDKGWPGVIDFSTPLSSQS